MSASRLSESDVEKWLAPLIKAFNEEEAACFIYADKLVKVCETLRQNKVNAECFVPRIVSIGPIYHKILSEDEFPDVRAGEELKKSVAERYATRYLKHKVSLIQVHKKVNEALLTAQKCYDQLFYNEDGKFTEMMFIDGLFLLAFMDSEVNGTSIKMRKHDRDLVCRDILLLENQIPFTVLRLLARIMYDMTTDDTIRFIKRFLSQLITHKFRLTRSFSILMAEESTENFPERSPNHLLDILRRSHFATSERVDERRSSDNAELLLSFPSATELKKVGIRCVSYVDSDFLSDVRFKSYRLSGELVLPLLRIDEWTKPMFLNLIGLSNYDGEEEDRGGAWISSYLWIMHKLIVKAEDVKELQDKGILQNRLADDQAVLDLFREIALDVFPDLPPFMKVRRQISAYLASRKLPLRIVFAEFKERYFSGPWSVLVFLAIIFTVTLTLIDTVFGGIQTYLTAHPPP